MHVKQPQLYPVGFFFFSKIRLSRVAIFYVSPYNHTQVINFFLTMKIEDLLHCMWSQFLIVTHMLPEGHEVKLG
jgi:hypothetical protein